MDLKPFVTGGRLSFRACQCMLFFSLGVKENREIFDDLLLAGREHVVNGGTDDNPVFFFEWIAQYFITNCTTNEIGFHIAILR